MFLVKRLHFEILINIFIILFFFITIFYNIKINYTNQYLALSRSFLQGKLYFPEGYWDKDLVLYNSKYYWHQGPFPAVALMPFIYLSNIVKFQFQQGHLQFFIVLVIFILCYKIARNFNYSRENSKYLSFAFCFASVFQFVAFFPVSWYFGQTLSLFLVLMAIYAYIANWGVRHNKYVLVGVILSLVLATRIAAILGSIFFIFLILIESIPFKLKIKHLAYIFLPIGLVGIVLLIYNYARFRNFFETGYLLNNQTLPLGYPFYGIRYLRDNLYTYFFKGLEIHYLNESWLSFRGVMLNLPFLVAFPSTSFFVVSPVFLYLFKVKIKERMAKAALITSLVILATLLCFYYPGGAQMGPRYMLDLLPFFYLLLLIAFKNRNLPNMAKILIIFSASFNLYLVLTRIMVNAGLII